MKDGQEAFFTAEIVPEPDNPHSEKGIALSIRWHGQVIGYFSEDDASEYQQLRRITASGYVPTASARLWTFSPDNKARNRRFYLTLSMQDPTQLFPLNDPPYGKWALLPHGSAVQVTKESDHLDVLLDYVPPSGEGQLLVTLHLIESGKKSKYEAVEIRLDGERIGELTKISSAKYAEAIRYFDDLGMETVSRATIRGSSLSAEVTLHSAKAHELSEDDLNQSGSPLPKLVPFEYDTDECEVPDAYVNPLKASLGITKKKSAHNQVKHLEPNDVPPIDPTSNAQEKKSGISPKSNSSESLKSQTQNSMELPKEVTKENPSNPAQNVHSSTPFEIESSPYVSSNSNEPAIPRMQANKANSSTSENPYSSVTSRTSQGSEANELTTALAGYFSVNSLKLIALVAPWFSLMFGLICGVTAMSQVPTDSTAALGYALSAMGCVILGGWPLYCRSRDRKALREWANDSNQNRELAQYLDKSDQSILNGIAPDKRPEPTPRKWKLILPISLLLLFGGMGIAGTALQDQYPDTPSGLGTPTVTTP